VVLVGSNSVISSWMIASIHCTECALAPITGWNDAGVRDAVTIKARW